MQGLLRNHNEILLLLEVGAATEVHISTGCPTQGIFNLSNVFKITISKSLVTFSHHPGPHTGLTQEQQGAAPHPNTFAMSTHMPHMSVFLTPHPECPVCHVQDLIFQGS